MEAIILSLLLLFSNASYSFGVVNPNQQNVSDTTTVVDQPDDIDDQNTMVENSSGGKTTNFDIDGF